MGFQPEIDSTLCYIHRIVCINNGTDRRILAIYMGANHADISAHNLYGG